MARRTNPYRLGRHVGRGGFADVYEAQAREGDGRDVAFKRPRDGVAHAVERLRREIGVQLRLDHPNVMPVLDVAEDQAWFVMPLATGSLLALLRDGRLDRDDLALAVEIVEQISRGLEHAHGLGFVHRDVSPGNILAIDEPMGSRRWVIADWGTVQRPPGETTNVLTGTGEGLGTGGFAAPETWTDARNVDARADVYSLGRVVAWLLTRQWPAPNAALLPDGPLRGFVSECTAADRERRLPSMARLRDRLHELLRDPPTSVQGQVQALVEEADSGKSEVARRAIEIASLYPQDHEIWWDELARLSTAAVTALTHEAPDLMGNAARTMLDQLDFDAWGRRNFDDMKLPLGWCHTVLCTLVDDGKFGLAEDVAVDMFEAEARCDRWPQKRVTIAWLRSLPEPAGAAMARAIRRSGARDYFAPGLQEGRFASRTLAAEFGR